MAIHLNVKEFLISSSNEVADVRKLPVASGERLPLDLQGLADAKSSLDDGAVLPGYGLWRDGFTKL